MLDLSNGRLQADLLVDQFYTSPPDIMFDSETQFYSHHDNYRVSYHLSPRRRDTTHSIICHERQPWTTKRQYEVDSSQEWVISGLEKICWIPPGYIGSGRGCYCWAGHDTLVMAGGDGMLRKLVFCSQKLRL